MAAKLISRLSCRRGKAAFSLTVEEEAELSGPETKLQSCEVSSCLTAEGERGTWPVQDSDHGRTEGGGGQKRARACSTEVKANYKETE